ncbi:hypothetical protein EGW08_019087, partial [Elysia chlorotica]
CQFYDEDVDEDDDDNHFIISLEDNGEEDEPDFHSGGRTLGFPSGQGEDLPAVDTNREYAHNTQPDLGPLHKKQSSTPNISVDLLKASEEQEIITFPSSIISKSVHPTHSAHRQTSCVVQSNIFSQSNLAQPSQYAPNLLSSLSSHQENILHPSSKQLPETFGKVAAISITPTSRSIQSNPETERNWPEAVFESRLEGSFVKTHDVRTDRDPATGVSRVEQALSTPMAASSVIEGNPIIASRLSSTILNVSEYISTSSTITSATTSSSNQQTHVPRLSGPFSESPLLTRDNPVTHAIHLDSCPCIMCFKSDSSNVTSKMQATPNLTREEIKMIKGMELQENGKNILIHSKPSVIGSVNSNLNSNTALPKLTPSGQLSSTTSYSREELYNKSNQIGPINNSTFMTNPAPPLLLHKSAVKRDMPRSAPSSASPLTSQQIATVSTVQTNHLQASQTSSPAPTVLIVSSSTSLESSNTPKQNKGIPVSSSEAPLLFQGSTKATKIGSLVLQSALPNSQATVKNSIQNSMSKSLTHPPAVLSQSDPKLTSLPNNFCLKQSDSNNQKVTIVLPDSNIPNHLKSAFLGQGGKITNQCESQKPQSGRSLINTPFFVQELNKPSSSGSAKAFQHMPAVKKAVPSVGTYNILYLPSGQVLLCRTPANSEIKKNSQKDVELKRSTYLPIQQKQIPSKDHCEPVVINGDAQALNSVLNNTEQIDLTTPGKVRINLKDNVQIENDKPAMKVSNHCSPVVVNNSQAVAPKYQEKRPESSQQSSHTQLPPQQKQAEKSPTKRSPVQTPKSSNVGVTGSTLLKLIDTHIENQNLTTSEAALLHLIKGACKDPKLLAATCQLAALSKSSAATEVSSNQNKNNVFVRASNTTVKQGNPSFNKQLQSVNTRTFITSSSHQLSFNNSIQTSCIKKVQGMDFTKVKSVNASGQPISNEAAESVEKGPRPPQERLPASYVQDWVNQSTAFMSNNKVDDLFYQDVRDIDHNMTHDVLPHLQSGVSPSPPKKIKRKQLLVAFREDDPSFSISTAGALPLANGHNTDGHNEDERVMNSQDKPDAVEHPPKTSNYVSNISRVGNSKNLSSTVTTSKGIKLKIRLNEKLKRHKALRKKSLERGLAKSSNIASIHHETEPSVSDSKINSPILGSHVQVPETHPADTRNPVALDNENKRGERIETAEEMFQRFQEQAQEEVYKAQLGVGYLSRSLRPARATVAFLDKLPYRDMGSGDRKKKKLETDQTEDETNFKKSDAQLENSAALNSEKTMVNNDIKDKKVGCAKKRKICNIETSGISKAKTSKVEFSLSDYPNFKEDTSFPFIKNVYCSNILAGHKVFVKFNTYENKNTGRCFLVPFFNIGGKRRQFDVEDVKYFNKAILEFEREERSCARHLLYFCREGNKASFLRKEGHFGGGQIHEKSYDKKSFTLEGFKMAAVKPKTSAAQDAWKVDKEIAIEIDTAEVYNDIDVDFDDEFLVPEGSSLHQPVAKTTEQINTSHHIDNPSSKAHMKQPVLTLQSNENLPVISLAKDAPEASTLHGYSNKSFTNGSRNVNEDSHLKAKGDSLCAEDQHTLLSQNVSSNVSLEPCLMEIKKEKLDYFEFGSELPGAGEMVQPFNFFRPLFPMMEIKKEPIDDGYSGDAYCQSQSMQTKDLSQNSKELYQEVGDHEQETVRVQTEVATQLVPTANELSKLKPARTSFVDNFSSKSKDLASCLGFSPGMHPSGSRQNSNGLLQDLRPTVHQHDNEAACAEIEAVTQPSSTMREINHSKLVTSSRDNIPSESQDLLSSDPTPTSILCTEVLSCDAEKVQVCLNDQQPTNAQIQDTDNSKPLNESEVGNKITDSAESEEKDDAKKPSETLGSPSEETVTCPEVASSSPESPAPSSSLSESSELLSSSDLEESDLDHCESVEAQLSLTNTPSVDLISDSDKKCGAGQHKITSLVESLKQRLIQQSSTLPSWLSDTAPPVIHSKIRTKRKKSKKDRSMVASEHSEKKDAPQDNAVANSVHVSSSTSTFVPLPEASVSGTECQPQNMNSASTSNTALSHIPTDQENSQCETQDKQEDVIISDAQKTIEADPVSSVDIVSRPGGELSLSETAAPAQPASSKVPPNETASVHADSESALSLPLLTGFGTSPNVLGASKQSENGFTSTDLLPAVQPKIKQEILDTELEDPVVIEFTAEQKFERKEIEKNLTSFTSELNQLPDEVPQSSRTTPSDIDIEVGCDDLPETAMRFKPIVPDNYIDIIETSSASSESSRLSPVAAVVDFLHKRTQALSKNNNDSSSKSLKKMKGLVSSNQKSNIAAHQAGSVASYLTQKYSIDMTPGSGVWHTIKGPRLRKAAFRRPAACVNKVETPGASPSDTIRSVGPISAKELSKKPSLSEIFGIPVEQKSKSQCQLNEFKRESDVEGDPKITINIRGSKRQVARKRTSVRTEKRHVPITESSQCIKAEPNETKSSTDLTDNVSTPLDSSLSPAQSEVQKGETVESSQASDTSSVKNKNVGKKSSDSNPKIRLTWRQLSKLSERQQREDDLQKINPCKVLLSRLEDTDFGLSIEPINPFTFRLVKESGSVKQDPDKVTMEADDLLKTESQTQSQNNKVKMLKRRKKKATSFKQRRGSAKPKKDIVDHFASMLDSLRKKAMQLEEEAMKKKQDAEKNKSIKKDVVKEEPSEENVLDQEEVSTLPYKTTDINKLNGGDQLDSQDYEQNSGQEGVNHETNVAMEEDQRNMTREVPEEKVIERDQEDKVFTEKAVLVHDSNEASKSIQQMEVQGEEKLQETKTLQFVYGEVESEQTDHIRKRENLTNEGDQGAIATNLEKDVHPTSALNQEHWKDVDDFGKSKETATEREDNVLEESMLVSTNSADIETPKEGQKKNEQKDPTHKCHSSTEFGEIVNATHEETEEADNSTENDLIDRDMQEPSTEECAEDNTFLDWEEPGALIIHLPEDEITAKKTEEETADQVNDVSLASMKINMHLSENETTVKKTEVGKVNIVHVSDVGHSKEINKQILLDEVISGEKESEIENIVRSASSYKEQESSKIEKLTDHQVEDSSHHDNALREKLNGEQSEQKKPCENNENKDGNKVNLTSFIGNPFSFPKTDVVLSSVVDEDLASLVKSSKKDDLMFEHQDDLDGDDMGVIPQEEVERLLGLCDDDSGPVVLPGLGPLPSFETEPPVASESQPLIVQSSPAEKSNINSSKVAPVDKFSPTAPCSVAEDVAGLKLNNGGTKDISVQESENVTSSRSSGLVYRLPSQTTVLSQNKAFDQQISSRDKSGNDGEANKKEGTKYSKTKSTQQMRLPKLNLKLDANAMAAIQKAKTAFLKKKNNKERRNLRSSANWDPTSNTINSSDAQFQQDMEFYMRSSSKEMLKENLTGSSGQKNTATEQENLKSEQKKGSLLSDPLIADKNINRELENQPQKDAPSFHNQILLKNSVLRSDSVKTPKVNQFGANSSSTDEISRKRKNDGLPHLDSSCAGATKLKKVESIFDDTDIFKEPMLKTSNKSTCAKSKPTVPVSELLKKTKGIDISKLKMKLNPVLSKNAAISSTQNSVATEKSQEQSVATTKKASIAEQEIKPSIFPQASSSSSIKPSEIKTVKEKASPINALNQKSSKITASASENKSNLKPLPNLNTAKLCNLLKNIQKCPVAVKSAGTVPEQGKKSISETKSQGTFSNEPSPVVTTHISSPVKKNNTQESKGKCFSLGEDGSKVIEKTSAKQTIKGLVGKTKKRRAPAETEEKSERSFFDCLSSDQTEIWEEDSADA